VFSPVTARRPWFVTPKGVLPYRGFDSELLPLVKTELRIPVRCPRVNGRDIVFPAHKTTLELHRSFISPAGEVVKTVYESYAFNRQMLTQ
jgi:hypothetical protein